jgi:hypothetical protein
MFRARLLVCGVLVAGAVAGSAPVALAGTPTPIPGSPGCVGHIVATNNHNSGLFGASGNPNSSAGPGYFFGPGTAAAVHGAKAFCG